MDIFEETADYRDLESRLYKYTDGWSVDSGAFPLKTKSERENAEAILSRYYYNVEDNHLDYDDMHVDGTNYKIIFSDPKEIDYDGTGENLIESSNNYYDIARQIVDILHSKFTPRKVTDHDLEDWD